MTNDPRTTEVLYQELDALKLQIGNLHSGMERLRRWTKVDQGSAMQKQEAELMDLRHDFEQGVKAMNNLAAAIVDQTERTLDPVKDSQAVHRYVRQERRREVTRNARHTDDLLGSTSPIPAEEKCHHEGHDHLGVLLVNSEFAVAHEMCPIDYWRSLWAVAWRSGKTEKFNEQYPLQSFLEDYSLD